MQCSTTLTLATLSCIFERCMQAMRVQKLRTLENWTRGERVCVCVWERERERKRKRERVTRRPTMNKKTCCPRVTDRSEGLPRRKYTLKLNTYTRTSFRCWNKPFGYRCLIAKDIGECAVLLSKGSIEGPASNPSWFVLNPHNARREREREKTSELTKLIPIRTASERKGRRKGMKSKDFSHSFYSFPFLFFFFLFFFSFFSLFLL